MATSSRATQLPRKRVKQIAEQAAAQIAAESPGEEAVIVNIEERPIEADTRTARSPEASLDLPRALVDVTFAWAEAALATQKEVARSLARVFAA